MATMMMRRGVVRQAKACVGKSSSEMYVFPINRPNRLYNLQWQWQRQRQQSSKSKRGNGMRVGMLRPLAQQRVLRAVGSKPILIILRIILSRSLTFAATAPSLSPMPPCFVRVHVCLKFKSRGITPSYFSS